MHLAGDIRGEGPGEGLELGGGGLPKLSFTCPEKGLWNGIWRAFLVWEMDCTRYGHIGVFFSIYILLGINFFGNPPFLHLSNFFFLFFFYNSEKTYSGTPVLFN